MNGKQNLQNLDNYLISVGIFLAAVLTAVYGVVPGINAVIANYAEIKKLQTQNDAIKKKTTLLASLDEGTLTNDMEVLMQAIPQEKAFDTIFALLEGVSGTAGLVIKDITINNPGSISSGSGISTGPTAKSGKTGSNIVSADFSTTGTLEQTANFLNTITNIRRLVRITDINMVLSGTKAEDIIIDSRFKMDAFYAPLPKTIGLESDVLTPLSANDDDFIAKIAAFPMAYQLTPPGPVIPNPGRTSLFSPF